MQFFTEEKLSERTIEDILHGKFCLALLLKRNGDLPGDIDDIVLQIVYGNMRKPPGSEFSPCDQLTVKIRDDEDDETNDGEKKIENNLVGIWAPTDKLTKALVLKHAFPNVSGPFKLPDEEPIPLCVAMAFDAFKTREVMELSQLYPGQVMTVGFFTSDKPQEATLISKTVEEFDSRSTPTTYEEKIVIQLAKTMEDCVRAFADLGPTYVSPDVDQGEIDCKFFFPDGYNAPKEVIQQVKKKFKRKGKGKAANVNQDEATSTATVDLVKEQEELDHEELEEQNSEDEKNDGEVLLEENVDDEEAESPKSSAREADKATSPFSDGKIEE
ncbi:unnamed protein product [Phyllotreta striolata]|uniref:DUF4746 domain-containing protein n=1 Tax=Phyllotreta striolata TaxID=444603 RepID=A0A9N9XSL2_PHYSR|nr:unnamed protein product [Phyllotreta striolata]